MNKLNIHTKWRVNIYPLIIIYCSLALNYLLNIILARWLTAIEYADYNIIIRLCFLFSIICLGGAQMSVMRYLPTYIHQQSLNLTKGFLTFHLQKILKLIIFGLTLQAIIFIFLFSISFDLTKNYPLTIILLFVWIIPFYAMMEYFTRLMQALHRFWLALLPMQVLQYILIMSFVGCIIYFFHYLTLYLALICAGLAITTISIFQYLAFRNILSPAVKEATAEFKSQWKHSDNLLFLSSLFFEMAKVIDLLLLKFLADSTATAIFAVILLFSSIFWYTGRALRFYAAPRVSILLHSKQMEQLKQLIRSTVIRALIVFSILMLIFLVFGEGLLLHFGTVYQQGYVSLLIVLFAISIEQIVGINIILLQAMHLERVLVIVNIINLCCMIVLDFIFIPKYGLIAAATIFGIMRLSAATARAVCCMSYFIKYERKKNG